MLRPQLYNARNCFLAITLSILIQPVMGWSAEDAKDPADAATQAGLAAAQKAECETHLEESAEQPATKRSAKRNAKTSPVSSQNSTGVNQVAQQRVAWSLKSFFDSNLDKNLAYQHPFTIANAAEKAYAMIMHVPPRDALDPLYRVSPVKVYPMLSGEHPATEGRMVVGQEESIAAFVGFLHSVARGDRSGKTLGFPGPAGTGKTELLYVLANLEKNLGKENKYKQFSYRWKNLQNVPYLSVLLKAKDGKLLTEFFDPDLPRSPFTLLREDMQNKVLESMAAPIRNHYGIVIADGWKHPEPKSAEIIRRIFEHHVPDIANGLITVDELSEDQYLDILSQYVVIVPKRQLRPIRPEPDIIRAQTDNPNYQALIAAPNIARAHLFPNGFQNPLAVDYTGKIVQQDGGLLMFDELFRNPGEFLNLLLEIIQNHVAENEYGVPVKLDIVPIWNSNDESIEKSREDNAIKALINRTDSPAMRSLLPPSQIEAVMPFQVGLRRFKMRKLDDTELKSMVHADVYPATDAHGKTHGAQGRYALYYDLDGKDVLIAPYTLNYIAWLASATRFVIDQQKLAPYATELNLVRANAGIVTNPVDRVRIAIGDKVPERADLMELTRVKDLLREGEGGITARDIETWLKVSLEFAANRGKKTITPLLVDQVFQHLLDKGRIKAAKDDIRARWQHIRLAVKLNLLLPKLDQEVKAIVSGDGQRAERIYDEIEREFIAVANDASATEVVPEDGSQRIYINKERLDEIRLIYRRKFGKEFEVGFLLRQLAGARRGQATRDPDLLEAVRIFLARHEAATADYISAFDSLYRGDSVDPSVRNRAAEVEPLLNRYGYDLESFKEAVAFVAQLAKEEKRAREAGLIP